MVEIRQYRGIITAMPVLTEHLVWLQVAVNISDTDQGIRASNQESVDGNRGVYVGGVPFTGILALCLITRKT